MGLCLFVERHNSSLMIPLGGSQQNKCPDLTFFFFHLLLELPIG